MTAGPDIVLVDGGVPDASPHSTLDRIWQRVAAILKHYAWFNADDARVRDMQHAIASVSEYWASGSHAGGYFRIPELPIAMMDEPRTGQVIRTATCR